MAETTTQSTKVIVTNITKAASSSNISDFFSFCGKITNLSLRDLEDSKEAIIEFETTNATTTAILLNNAIIINQPITVQLYTPQTEKEKQNELNHSIPTDEITQREFNAPDSERSKTSVIATLIGHGYHLAHDALQKAHEIDKNYEISQKVNSGYEQLKGKALEIDKNYGISEGLTKKMSQVDTNYHVTEKYSSLKATTSEKVKQIDSNYNISEKTNQGVQTLKTGFWNGLERVKTDITKLQNDYPAFAELTQKVKNVVEEVRGAINEQNEIYWPKEHQNENEKNETETEKKEENQNENENETETETEKKEGPPLPPKEQTPQVTEIVEE